MAFEVAPDLRQSKFDADNIVIQSFPSGSDIWRVDWFGSVDYVDRNKHSQNPSVEVFLSKVKPTNPNRPFPDLYARLGAVDPPEQVRRVVSVGTLVLLRVGSLWQNRRYIGDEEAVTKDFDNVRVDDPHLIFVKAGERDNSGFLYPMSEHPWHMQSTASYCAYIKLSSEHGVVIPCFEILRFYFGSSAALLSRLFKPALRREDLYVPSKTHVKPEHASRIELADGISSASGIDIARIAGNPMAWRSAVNIGKSILRNTEKGRFVRLGFPFSGTTKLKVKGKWLTSNLGLRRIFAVFQLLQCSHPLPFKSLNHKVSSAPASDASKRKFGRTQFDSKQSTVQKSDQAVEPSTLVEQDPGQLVAKHYKFYGARRFIDLENKKVHGEIINKNTSEPTYLKKSHINMIAIGGMGSAPGIRPIDMIEANTKFETAPRFLQLLLNALSIENIRFEALTTAGLDGWTQPLIQFQYFSELTTDLTLMFDERDMVGPPRPRLLSIIISRYGAQSALWVVIENEKILPMVFPVEDERLGGIHEIPQMEMILSTATSRYKNCLQAHRAVDEIGANLNDSSQIMTMLIKEWLNCA